jgi:hypothetical protein
MELATRNSPYQEPQSGHAILDQLSSQSLEPTPGSKGVQLFWPARGTAATLKPDTEGRVLFETVRHVRVQIRPINESRVVCPALLCRLAAILPPDYDPETAAACVDGGAFADRRTSIAEALRTDTFAETEIEHLPRFRFGSDHRRRAVADVAFMDGSVLVAGNKHITRRCGSKTARA